MATEGSEVMDGIPADIENAAKRLEEAGDEAGALKLRLSWYQGENVKYAANERTRANEAFKAGLAKEFEYADPDLITGTTEKEMRASAERIHTAFAKIVETRGLKPDAAAAKKLPTAADFGQPPAIAAEVVGGEMPMEFRELSEKARTGQISRAEVLRTIKNDGAPRITRQTIAGAIQGRGEPKPAAQ